MRVDVVVFVDVLDAVAVGLNATPPFRCRISIDSPKMFPKHRRSKIFIM